VQQVLQVVFGFQFFKEKKKSFCSEISYITVGELQTPSWEFDTLDRMKWAKENEGKAASIGIVLGYQV
jgi:hypothetical protein